MKFVMIGSLDAMLAADADYRLVPGHGSIGDAGDVAGFRDYLKTVRTLVAAVKAEGRSGDEAVEKAVPVLRERYGQWEFFAEGAEANVRETYEEPGGSKRVPLVHLPTP